MLKQIFPRSFKPAWPHYSALALIGLYVLINLFHLGGDSFVFNLNNNIVSPLALAVTLLALLLWRRVAVGGQNRLLWSGLTIGWALWTVAELWWAVAALIGQEVPYPSLADFFWLAGYIPMAVALWVRIGSLPRNFTSAQRLGLWLSVAFSIGWTIFFVLIPILQSNDPSAVLESILNVIYPLVDLVLLVLVLQIFFTYQQGMAGWAWAWFSVGFLLHSISNLIFSYAAATDLYYPAGQVNLISTLGVDIPYNLSYVFWIGGLFIVQALNRQHQNLAETNPNLALVPNTHLLVFTRGDDAVTSVSQNYGQVYSSEVVSGKSVAETLGCEPEAIQRLLAEIRARGALAEQRLPAQTRFGEQPISVSGIVISGVQQREYVGAILLVRLLAADYQLDATLTDYEREMVQSLLVKTGLKRDEAIKQLLAGYTLVFLKSFYNRSFVEGGSLLAEAFVAELQAAARQISDRLEVSSTALLEVGSLSLEQARAGLPALVKTARQFVARISDEAAADSLYETVRARFDAPTMQNIAYFEQAPRKEG